MKASIGLNEQTIDTSEMKLFYECGGCGMYHPVLFEGDCRDDSNRFTGGELDAQLGTVGWNEVEE